MAEQFDLQKEFDEANTKYFSGKLKPVQLKWHTRLKNLGYVKATVTKKNRYEFIVHKILHLAMNKTVDWTREAFLRTFLHELCHLYMLQNYTEFNWVGGYHGEAWVKLAASVGKMANISDVDQESENVPLTTKNEYIKDKYILLFDKHGISYGLIDTKIIEPFESSKSSIERQLIFHQINPKDVELYKTRLGIFNRIPVKRNDIRKFNFRDRTTNQQAAENLRAGKDGSERIL